ncbi:hypothetical protein VaNZ11_008396, partial [Volvox africanus]
MMTTRTLSVAICAAASSCISWEAVTAADIDPRAAILIQPPRERRLILPGANYPDGVFVLTDSSGVLESFSVEVCARVPQEAVCSEAFGVMSIMRPADAWPSETIIIANGPYGAVRSVPTPWSSYVALLAATAADSPLAVLTSSCAPPPGIDAWRKVVFSWGWDFGGLPPSLASSGFVAVYRRYPLTTMSPGSYAVKFMKPENVSLAVIVSVKDGNPDVAGTLAEVREVVAAAGDAILVVPGGDVRDITFVYHVPPLENLNNVTKM